MAASEPQQTFAVLVTGANSGLGFAICCRLIDEFLFTRPQSQTLHLLFSTRDAKKSQDTERRLRAHLQRTLRAANGKTLGISLVLEARIKLEGVQVDLLKLLSVKALAEDLRGRPGFRIDAVVWNAGIAGWTGLNWFKATWMIITDLVHATTYPTYTVCDVGLTAKRQIDRPHDGGSDEPQLGQVFTANVFGHYLLTHWLSPLLRPTSRIIWTSSISAVAETFSPADIQGLRAPTSYEASKRLTDYLVLTSALPSTEPFVRDFLPDPPPRRPTMYLTHPGICGTSIANVPWILELLMFAAFYLARLLGSPWHVTVPYKGAVSACFAVLAPAEQLADREVRDGKGKWGSATSVWGDERVARTPVEGWGYGGTVGTVPAGSVTKSLFRGRRETTKESREDFEETGRQVWREMEQMRRDWESRLGWTETTLST